MALAQRHLRIVVIDGVALEDAPPPPASHRVAPVAVVRQQREIRRMRQELRRLGHGRPGARSTER
jgi:hypothetical protein